MELISATELPILEPKRTLYREKLENKFEEYHKKK
jgi:hypothetical protein